MLDIMDLTSCCATRGERTLIVVLADDVSGAAELAGLAAARGWRPRFKPALMQVVVRMSLHLMLTLVKRKNSKQFA